MHSAGSSSVAPFTPTPDDSTFKYEGGVAKTSSRAGTPKPRSNSKRNFQDVFAEGSARENQALERQRAQKHERTIGELDLKRRRLENKALEQQYQREHEREQHEYRMMQMRMMSQRAVPGTMQSQNGEYGLLAELNAATLPSESSTSLTGLDIL